MKATLVLLLAAVALPVWADDDLPGSGFQSGRYEKLWTKSPFSVATPDAVDASPDYTLVGVEVLEGVSYVSVVDAHTGDHFIVSSAKDTKGLKLSSINHGSDGKEVYATILKDGQPLTLKLSTQPVAIANPVPGQVGENPPPQGMAPPMPMVQQNIPMPGANPTPVAPGVTRPFSRLHRQPIHLPPVPAPQGQPSPANGQSAPNGGAPLQPHTVPPQ